MSIRILVGTEPGSDFKHAILWNSTTDIAFGPVFYERGKPHFLDPGDVAEAFGKWVGWDKLTELTNDDLKEKQHEMEELLDRPLINAKAEGHAAGQLAVADIRGTGLMERIEEAAENQAAATDSASPEAHDAKSEFEEGYQEVLMDEWGRLSTDNEHPWAIVFDQEKAWHEGFRSGFELAFRNYLVEVKAFYAQQEGK